jgi:hypothetical protein
MNPLQQMESRPCVPGEDPALAFLDKPHLIEPKHTDFWWEISAPIGPAKKLPLFPTCRDFLSGMEGLATFARALFQEVHDPSAFLLPPR